jgi:hypothetical protein
MTRRNIFPGLALAAASAPREVDPVFTAIARGRAAAAAFEVAAANDFGRDRPKRRSALAACRVCTEALAELIETVPTTLAGLAAMLAFVDDIAVDEMDEDTLAGFVSTLRKAVDRLAIEALRATTEAA